MRSGPLRHRVTFQERGQAISASGAIVVTWTDSIVNLAADVIEQEKSKKEIGTPQTVAESDVLIRIRARAGIRVTMRVKWNATFGRGLQIFEIVGIAAAKNHAAYLDIRAKLIEQDGLQRG